MTDAARAEITNGIWLCRNCHKLIDSDEQEFSCNILFAWRETHEKYVRLELGTKGDQIRFEDQQSQLKRFEDCPPIVRRIVVDRPEGWEWRFTAELMRHFNGPLLRQLQDLRDGLYVKPLVSVSRDEALDWIGIRLREGQDLVKPISVLMQRLTTSFGETGVSGDVEEIFHVCCLIRDYLEQTVLYEEQLAFTKLPEEFGNLQSLIRDLVGSQVEKLSGIPKDLDDVIVLIGTDHGGTEEEPLVIQKMITFEAPEDLEEKVSQELSRLFGKLTQSSIDPEF